MVYATFAGYKETTTEGMKIHLLLPHTIYILPKQEVRKDELVVKTTKFDSQSEIVTVRVENTSPTFCRVLEADVTSPKDKATNNGFRFFRTASGKWRFPAKPPPN